MMSNPFDMDDLLGAYALDAVSDDERRAVEDYLLANPRARAEVQEHREVATMLAWSGMDAPEGLWDRIAENLEGTETAPVAELGDVLPMRPARRKKTWSRTAGSWVAATAAAASIAVVAVKVSNDDDTTTSTAGPTLDEIYSNPSSVQAELTSPDDSLKVRAVIDPEGHGYLSAESLPDLAADRTYQLWGRVDGQNSLISLGLLGSAPKTAAFTIQGDVSLLAVTEEVSGGVVSSANEPVVEGAPA